MQPLNQEAYDTLLKDIALIEGHSKRVPDRQMNVVLRTKDELLEFGAGAQIYPAVSVLISACAFMLRELDNEASLNPSKIRRPNAPKRFIAPRR